MVVMTAVNLLSARSYGEFEFWFSSIKVAAIVAFILVTAAYAFGLTSPQGTTFANLTAHGGFAPKGWVPVLAAVTTVFFSLVGAEIATVAAAESKDPREGRGAHGDDDHLADPAVLRGLAVPDRLRRAWPEIKPGESPFTLALNTMGFGWGSAVMSFIILTAVLSCLNSAVYVCSRVLHVMADRGDAPRWLVEVNARRVPARSILLGSLVGVIGVIIAIVSPSRVFAFLRQHHRHGDPVRLPDDGVRPHPPAAPAPGDRDQGRARVAVPVAQLPDDRRDAGGAGGDGADAGTGEPVLLQRADSGRSGRRVLGVAQAARRLSASAATGGDHVSDQGLPTYLSRQFTLSKSQLATELGAELLSLCQSVTADGRLAPEELEGLRRWLSDATAADIPALSYLRTSIERVLADGRITPEEYRDVYRAVEAILPFEARKQALAARQQVESAEASAAGPVGLQAGRGFGPRHVAGIAIALAVLVALYWALF